MPTHKNYMVFQEIRSQLKGLALRLGRGDQFTSEEIFNEASDLFVVRYVDATKGIGGAIRLGKLQLLEAARNLGYLARKDVAMRDFVGIDDIGELPAQIGTPDPVEALFWASRLEQLKIMIRRACPRGQLFFKKLEEGLERDEAALAAGLSQVEVTRLIQLLANKLNGRPAAGGYMRRDRAGEAGQMALFGA